MQPLCFIDFSGCTRVLPYNLTEILNFATLSIVLTIYQLITNRSSDTDLDSLLSGVHHIDAWV